MKKQLISFEIHNPHAPNVRCSVTRMDGQRCGEQAYWGVVEPIEGVLYRLTAYCLFHSKSVALESAASAPDAD